MLDPDTRSHQIYSQTDIGASRQDTGKTQIPTDSGRHRKNLEWKG